jgi:hypothetical protein
MPPRCGIGWSRESGRLDPLRHPFDITLNFGPDTQKIHINPGQTLYFQYTIYPWMGTVFEVSEDQVEARQTASGLKPQD